MLQIPPPIWGVALLAIFYVASEAPLFASLPLWRWPAWGAALTLFGFAIPLAAFVHFLAVRTQFLPTSKTNNRLVVTGLYRFSRNPMYVGMVAAALGVALWFGRPLMLLAPVLLFALIDRAFIPFEEAKMRAQFGQEFDAYVKRVRRWL